MSRWEFRSRQIWRVAQFSELSGQLVGGMNLVLRGESATAVSRSNERDKTASLDDPAVLIEQLPSPRDAPRSPSVLLNLFDLGDDLDAIAKENGGLKLPIRDADQGEGRDAGVLRAQARQHAQTE